MKHAKLSLMTGCILATATACGPPNNTFSGAPIPKMVALTCDFRGIQSGALNPDYSGERPSGRLILTFTNMDAENSSATLVGNQGAGRVEFRQRDDQWQFIEETISGTVTVTSVFAPPSEGASLPAVHSRHLLMAPANASISQYAGSCRPKF
jgi:hypothetical protein